MKISTNALLALFLNLFFACNQQKIGKNFVSKKLAEASGIKEFKRKIINKESSWKEYINNLVSSTFFEINIKLENNICGSTFKCLKLKLDSNFEAFKKRSKAEGKSSSLLEENYFDEQKKSKIEITKPKNHIYKSTSKCLKPNFNSNFEAFKKMSKAEEKSSSLLEKHYVVLQKKSKIKIIKGPFKNYIANFDKKNNLWIIDGNLTIAPKMEKYTIGNELAPGVTFYESYDYPKNFKKIYWETNIYGIGSNGESNLQSGTCVIKDLLNKGFGVILSPPRPFLRDKDTFIDNDSVLFHPNFLKSAKEFCKITGNNFGRQYNHYEIGALLGYRIADIYAWCFGVDEARKAFPNKNFEWNKKGYSNIYDWKKQGLSRLKALLGEEFKYVIAGDDPLSTGV